tara:strand:+ start:527 stop:883 length:357 start_codon:yes stop_codon:yes gene_type:complete
VIKDSLQSLILELRAFSKERDWDQFHSPKNLSMALATETGELMEHFQWITETESQNIDDSKKVEVSFEMADILLYLVRMADMLEIDLIEASHQKMAVNHKKYPIALSKGKHQKYTELK